MPLLKYVRTMMVELATEMMRCTMGKDRKTKLFIFSFKISKGFIIIKVYLSIFRIYSKLSIKRTGCNKQTRGKILSKQLSEQDVISEQGGGNSLK